MTSPAEQVQHAIVDSPFGKRLELRTEAFEPDRVRVRMPFSPDRTTLGDLVHGGAIAALVDAAATAAAWSGVEDPTGWRGTTIGLALSFLEGARGVDLCAEAHVVRRGGSICVCDVEVRPETGPPVARATVTYKLSRREPPAARPAAEVLAGLFAGGSAAEQKALLAELERAGAAVYRTLAAAEPDPAARAALLDAAEREEQNARALDALPPAAPART